MFVGSVSGTSANNNAPSVLQDCFGDVLYEVSAEWMTDMDGDGNQLMLGFAVRFEQPCYIGERCSGFCLRWNAIYMNLYVYIYR